MHRKLLLQILFASCVAFFPCHLLPAQGWTHTFAGQHPGTIAAAGNDGFFCSTLFKGFVKRLDGDGNPLWQTPNQDNEIIPGLVPDPATSGCFALREPTSGGAVSLLHFDAFGVRDGQWNLDVYTNDLWRPRLARHPEGGLIVAGIFDGKLTVLRITESGAVLWKKNYTAFGDFAGQKFRGMLTVSPTGFIALTSDESTGFYDVTVLFLLDADGNTVWHKQFNALELNMQSIVATADSSVVVLGYNNNTSLLRKYRADQTLAFQAVLPQNVQPPGGGAVFTSTRDGGFIMLNGGNQLTNYKPLMAKLNPSGLVIWSKTLRFSGFTSDYFTNFYQLIEAQNGDFATIGEVSTSTTYDMIVVKTDASGRIFSNRVMGNIFADANNNCLPNVAETPKTGWLVRLENTSTGEVLLTATDSTGHYEFEVGTGFYFARAVSPNSYWFFCSTAGDVEITVPETTHEVHFAAQKAIVCPFLEVDVGAPFLRRCFENNYTVRYCNTGTAAADNAYIVLQIDPFQQLVGAGLPFSQLDAHTFRLDLGKIEPDVCGQFPVKIYVACDSTFLGQTLCAKAHIYPDSLCIQAANFSGASIAVSGICTSNGVQFKVKNEGTHLSTAGLKYRVIVDGALMREAPFQLPATDILTLPFPADGRTWRLEAQQEPNHPGQSRLSATIEGCGQNAQGSVSMGFVSQFSESDDDPFISIDCQPIIGSFDPNDKAGFPLGYGLDHRIEPGQPLEYRIRFQNTGTDTAFTVVVRDTLPGWLDAASIVPGAASHPYRFEMLGTGILKFTFENILLPDSNKNEAASHGFVKFRVSQHSDVPLGAVIKNRAAIYFDFNEAVLTNFTQHLVDEIALPVPVYEPDFPIFNLKIAPNPSYAADLFFIEHLPDDAASCSVTTSTGRLVWEQNLSDNQLRLGEAGLMPGIYWLRVFDGEKRLRGVGKLILVP